MNSYSLCRLLSRKDLGALAIWNQGFNALEINRTLRGGELGIYRWNVADLDSVISAGSFAEVTVAYRGIAISNECFVGLTVGQEYLDLGYISVSLDRDIAVQMADKRSGIPNSNGPLGGVTTTGDVPVVLEIHIPAGVSAARLQGNGLDEFVLARNSRLKIESIVEHFVQVAVVWG
jgi:hypothetical protein